MCPQICMWQSLTLENKAVTTPQVGDVDQTRAATGQSTCPLTVCISSGHSWSMLLGPMSACQGRTLPYGGFQRVWVTANTRLTQDSAPGFQTTSVRSNPSYQDNPAHHPSQGNLGSLLCDARTAPSISLPWPLSFSSTRINHLKWSPEGVLPHAGPLSQATGPLVSSRPHWCLVNSALSTALGSRWAIKRRQAGPWPTSTSIKLWR